MPAGWIVPAEFGQKRGSGDTRLAARREPPWAAGPPRHPAPPRRVPRVRTKHANTRGRTLARPHPVLSGQGIAATRRSGARRSSKSVNNSMVAPSRMRVSGSQPPHAESSTPGHSQPSHSRTTFGNAVGLDVWRAISAGVATVQMASRPSPTQPRRASSGATPTPDTPIDGKP